MAACDELLATLSHGLRDVQNMDDGRIAFGRLQFINVGEGRIGGPEINADVHRGLLDF